MTKVGWFPVLAMAWVAAVGCSQVADVRRDPGRDLSPSASPSSSPAGVATGADLAARKQAAGIDDCPTSDPDVRPVEQGLPDVVLQCLGGGTPVRLAGLRGRPMLVNVWAQWCPPCRQEAPFLSEVAATSDRKLDFLGIDYNDPRPELAIDFAEVAAWTYPQLVDQDKAISVPLQLVNIPQTLLVDADGRVVFRHAGPFRSSVQIRQLVRHHLGVTV